MDNEYQVDIDGTIEALRTAWKFNPEWSLHDLLREVIRVPLTEVTSNETIELLNEFILQNQ